jgi:hypothetical protein
MSELMNYFSIPVKQFACLTPYIGMCKKREFIEGSFYHVTSRTNNKIRVFENNIDIGRLSIYNN